MRSSRKKSRPFGGTCELIFDMLDVKRHFAHIVLAVLLIVAVVVIIVQNDKIAELNTVAIVGTYCDRDQRVSGAEYYAIYDDDTYVKFSQEALLEKGTFRQKNDRGYYFLPENDKAEYDFIYFDNQIFCGNTKGGINRFEKIGNIPFTVAPTGSS
jgi:hypothetical protein